MIGIERKLRAFLIRDFRISRSYRLSFILQMINIASGLWMYFFLSRALNVTGTPGANINGYGGDLFAFILVGMAFSNLQNTAMTGAITTIRAEQRSGTLEALLTTPIPPWLIILGGIGLPLLISIVEIVLYLAGGAVFFGTDWSHANWPALMVLLILAVAHGIALGLWVAALIIIVKRGEQITYLLLGTLTLITGVYYPVEVLPLPLQAIAEVIPITHALRAIRRALFSGSSIDSLATEITILGLSTLLLALLGVWLFNRALDYARSEGSLSQF
jgi:ABC-2 type transport system permease protein